MRERSINLSNVSHSLRRKFYCQDGRLLLGMKEVYAILDAPKDAYYTCYHPAALRQIQDTLHWERPVFTKGSILPGGLVYRGLWYQQIGGSCTVWALANVLVGKARADATSAFFEEMLIDMQASARNYDRETDDFGISVQHSDEHLAANAKELQIKVLKDEEFGYKDMDEVLKMAKEGRRLNLDEVKRQSAAALVNFLKRGGGITASIIWKDFYGIRVSPDSQDRGGHRIAVMGYNIDNNGKLALQILDSNYGLAWVGFEYFFCHAKSIRALESTKPKSERVTSQTESIKEHFKRSRIT